MYIQNTAKNYNGFLNELIQRNFYKLQGRPPYSASIIWYGLHLCHMSLQVYRLFFEKFPMSSLPLLNKIQKGGVKVLKALKTLYEKGSFSCDFILMIDEIYLQKSAQYQLGEYVGVDKERNLHKGIVAFMVVDSC